MNAVPPTVPCSGSTPEGQSIDTFRAVLFDAARIGADIFSWSEFLESGVGRLYKYYPMHNVLQYCDPDKGKLMAEKLIEELKVLLMNVSVKIVHDYGVVEIRSFLGTRGDIVKTLLHQYHEQHHHNPEFVMCLGDSIVDEPMFQ